MTINKLIIAALAVLSLASCERKVVISGTISDSPNTQIELKRLDVNVFTVLDTIKTDSNSNFKYKIDVAKGQPEFVYLYKGETRLASLLLLEGDKVVVKADTLGNFSVEGSPESEKLAEIDKSFNQFMQDLYNANDDSAKMAKLYLDYYRSNMKYVMSNFKSLTIIPVLYQRMSEVSPIFGQSTDAIVFKQAADSLKTIYPDSRYVKALIKEANQRMNLLAIENKIKSTTPISYPDVVMSNIKGDTQKLSEVEAKVIILNFWDVNDAVQKMMNIEVLRPLYKKYHSKGLEIFSVCISADKSLWGSVVSSQKLEWINVCDGLGAASPVVRNYNITSLPQSLIIANGELNLSISTEEQLYKELDKLLK